MQTTTQVERVLPCQAYRVSGIQTQLLVFVRQALYPLSCSPGTTVIFLHLSGTVPATTAGDCCVTDMRKGYQIHGISQLVGK